MKTYRIVNYFDVWGNEKDGWEVNNVCQHGEYVEREAFNDRAEMLAWLKNMDFLAKYVRLNMLEIEWLDDDFIEISRKANGCPVCRIEGVRV